MSWRTVIIEGRCKLDYHMGYMVVRSKEIRRVFLEEIAVLVIENTAVSLTASLLEALVSRKIRVIFCDSNDAPIPMAKHSALADSFVPFDLNRKPLLTRLISVLTQRADAPENTQKTARLLADAELWLDDVAMDLPCDVVFTGLSSAALIKAAAPEIRSDSDSIAEKMLDWMELTEELDREKLFFTVNMRSYVPDEDMEAFVDTVLSHGYQVIGIESSARPFLTKEKRVTIDADLCEIS